MISHFGKIILGKIVFRGVKFMDAKANNRKDYLKRYRAENKESINAYQRQWRAEHPEKIKEYNQRYWMKKLQLA